MHYDRASPRDAAADGVAAAATEHDAGRRFRIECCHAIEEAAAAVPVASGTTQLRIGLVLAAAEEPWPWPLNVFS